MREKLLTLIVSTIATVLAAESFGQTCPGGYCVQAPAAYGPGGVAYYWPTYRVAAPAYQQPVYRVTVPVPQPVAMTPAAPVPQQSANGYGAALAVINGARASAGRGPLAWSSTLAAYAATNNAVHAPGSSGGASQCWAGMADPVQAAYAWIASPAHWALLVNATSEIGISACATGMTCNAR